MIGTRPSPALLAVLALLAALVAVPAAPVAAQGADDLAVIKDAEAPSNAEIATRLSEETDLAGTIPRVLISRDDNFADALASGLLQRESPLLLVPSQGPVPDRVLGEIRRLGADDVVILGGTGAVAQAVGDQLAAEGLGVQRRQGGSRIETAIDIAASDAPDATTAILARAFPTNPDDPTQGFADALGAGAMAAERGWPILLSDTGSLSAATRDYLAASDITEVKLIGGTAALSAEVEQAINALGIATDRIAGPSRGATALEIGKELGADSAADVAHVVLVDGTGPDAWAGGFASARRAAMLDAPVLLADGVRLLPESQEFLEPGSAFAQAGELTITCVVHPLACTEGRRALGLVDLPLLDVDPPIDSLVQAGQQITLTLTPTAEGAGQPVEVKGTCLDAPVEVVTDGGGQATFVLSSALGTTGTCSVEIGYGGEDGILQGFSYVLDPAGGRNPEAVYVASDVFNYGSVVPDVPLYLTDRISCEGPAGAITQESSAYLARYLHPDFHVQDFALTSVPLEALPGDTCTATAQAPPGVGRVLWGVYSWADPSLRNPLLLGNGTTATFGFDDLAGGVTDVNIVWILETHSGDIGLPPPPASDFAGPVFNPEGLPADCDGQPVPQGFSFQPPGATCTVGSDLPGRQALVVEPGRPLQPAPSTTFTPQTTDETVGLYSIGVRSGDIPSPGQSCAGAPELPFATITSGYTTPAQPVGYHSFEVFPGESLRFRADNAFGDFEFGIDPILTLYGPDGSVVASNDDGDTAYNSRIDLIDAAAGTYCLEVSGYGNSTGDYLLTADPAPQFGEAGEFTPSQPAVGYFYEGTEGDLLVIELRALGFAATDPLVQLTGPGGTDIVDDDGGGFPNSRIEFVLPATGRYDIIATTYQGTSYGPYQIELSWLSSGGFSADGTGRPPPG